MLPHLTSVKETAMRILIVLFLAVLSTAQLGAQTDSPTYRWFGDLRVRGEVDMRDFRQQTPANAYTVMRTRFGVEVKPLEDVRVLFQLRDSRVFGQERDGTGAFNTLGDSRNLDLHQGFVEIRKFLFDELTVKLGRQELSYGNERLIGTVGWNNVGRVFDGGVARLEPAGLTIDILALRLAEVKQYPSAATPTAVQYVKDAGADLFGIYGTSKGEGNSLDGYVLYQTDRNQTVPGANDLKRWTLGALLRGKGAALTYDLEAAYQTGTRRGANVAAYLLAGSLSYTFEESPLRRLGLGYDRLSGSKAGSAKHKSFDPMFHTGHKFYGFMDYFIGFPGSTADRGLIDLYGRGTVNISQVLVTNIWVHSFQPESDQRLLGHEVDCVVSYRMSGAVSLEGGASAFLPGVVMRERFVGASTSFWGFLALSVSF